MSFSVMYFLKFYFYSMFKTRVMITKRRRGHRRIAKTTRQGRNHRKFSSDEQLPSAAANIQLRQMHKAKSPNHLACRKRFHASVIRALETANKENCCWLSCYAQISLVPARSVIRWKMRGLAFPWNRFWIDNSVSLQNISVINGGVRLKFVFLQGKRWDIMFWCHKRVQVKDFSRVTFYDSTYGPPTSGCWNSHVF